MSRHYSILIEQQIVLSQHFSITLNLKYNKELAKFNKNILNAKKEFQKQLRNALEDNSLLVHDLLDGSVILICSSMKNNEITLRKVIEDNAQNLKIYDRNVKVLRIELLSLSDNKLLPVAEITSLQSYQTYMNKKLTEDKKKILEFFENERRKEEAEEMEARRRQFQKFLNEVAQTTSEQTMTTNQEQNEEDKKILDFFENERRKEEAEEMEARRRQFQKFLNEVAQTTSEQTITAIEQNEEDKKNARAC